MEMGMEWAMIKRARPASEEDQDDGHSQEGPDDGLMLEILDRFPNERRLVGDRPVWITLWEVLFESEAEPLRRYRPQRPCCPRPVSKSRWRFPGHCSRAHRS